MSADLPLPSLRRSVRLVQRNLLVYKHVWSVILSGFFEPLFYLLGIGFGLGGMIPDIQGLNYRAFIVPGLLAASCMNGAISDGFINVFFKLNYQRTYEGILATPLRVEDIAFGEMLWALIRGSLYAVCFLLLVFVLGETLGPPMLLSPWAVLAAPAAILISAAFASMALCITTMARKVQDFDIVIGLFIMPMFLFSGTFFPTSQLPDSVGWVVASVPLSHAVELLRQLTTGAIDSRIAVHVAYLVAVGCVTFAIAMRRLERALVK